MARPDRALEHEQRLGEVEAVLGAARLAQRDVGVVRVVREPWVERARVEGEDRDHRHGIKIRTPGSRDAVAPVQAAHRQLKSSCGSLEPMTEQTPAAKLDEPRLAGCRRPPDRRGGPRARLRRAHPGESPSGARPVRRHRHREPARSVRADRHHGDTDRDGDRVSHRHPQPLDDRGGLRPDHRGAR